jgi:hypothetical protein
LQYAMLVNDDNELVLLNVDLIHSLTTVEIIFYILLTVYLEMFLYNDQHHVLIQSFILCFCGVPLHPTP